MTRPEAAGLVLVVEDDPDIAAEIVDCLAADGIATLRAASGEAALALVGRHGARIGIVLTDLRLPGIGGLELIDRLQAAPGGAPAIVLMSGHASAAEEAAARQAGVVAMLRKPFDLAALDEALARATAAARARRDAGRCRAAGG